MPLLVVLVALKRYHPFSCLIKNHFILCADKIPYIELGENDERNSAVVTALTTRNNQAVHSTSKRPITNNLGKENSCCDDNPPPPKRGRKSGKDSGHRCGSCTVWLQTGGNKDLEKYHNMAIGRVRHPGDRAIEFSNFVSCNGAYANISLRIDSCLCDACYRDCIQASGKPRLSEHAVYKHCILCCEGQLEDCSCKRIVDWGTPVWYDDDETLQLWLQYFKCTGYTIRDDDKHFLCKSHYVSMRQVVSNHLCSICKCTSADKWNIGQNLIKELGSSSSGTDIQADDWVCEACFMYGQNLVAKNIINSHKSRMKY